jgi:hypothetical protein
MTAEAGQRAQQLALQGRRDADPPGKIIATIVGSRGRGSARGWCQFVNSVVAPGSGASGPTWTLIKQALPDSASAVMRTALTGW